MIQCADLYSITYLDSDVWVTMTIEGVSCRNLERRQETPMRRKQVIELRFEPIGDGSKWDKRIAVLECGHTREAVVPAGSKRGATKLRCYKCSTQNENDV